MIRGILSTVYAAMKKNVSQGEIDSLYQEFYKNERFVRPCTPGTFPSTQFVRGSNYCDIGCKVDARTGRLIVISAIDNLVKGAAGQAVQNMNLVLGLDEEAGLAVVPLFP